MRRYICSWLFDALPKGDQETLGLLAEGKIPDYLIPQVAHYAYDLEYKATWDPPSFSDERAAFLYALFLGDEMGEDWGKDESCISFTVMGLGGIRGVKNSPVIPIALKPLYEQ